MSDIVALLVALWKCGRECVATRTASQLLTLGFSFIFDVLAKTAAKHVQKLLRRTKLETFFDATCWFVETRTSLLLFDVHMFAKSQKIEAGP